MNKNGKGGDRKASNPIKDDKLKSPLKSLVELDARLISALLTVSILPFQVFLFITFGK